MTLLESLEEYFENTPREQLEKDWKNVEDLQQVGPTVDEYIEYIHKLKEHMPNEVPN